MTLTYAELVNAGPKAFDGYKVDVSRGERVGRVSSEWFSRPADERFLSLTELFASVIAPTAAARAFESAPIRVEASRDDTERLALVLPGATSPSRQLIGASASLQPRSARRPPTCGNSPRRLQASICNMA